MREERLPGPKGVYGACSNEKSGVRSAARSELCRLGLGLGLGFGFGFGFGFGLGLGLP